MCDEVIFSFDGDRAGRAAAWRALENALPQIKEGRQVRFVFLPEGQDPDSYVQEKGADAFVKALDEALPLSDFLIEELSSQVDMASVDGRARLAELARPLISLIPPGVYRELLTERLAETVGLPGHKLEAILAKDEVARPVKTPVAATRLRARSQGSGHGKPSIVRRAITLILHSPAAALNVDVEGFAGISKPGSDLLRDLIETVHAEPNMTTAGLLERFRNDPEGQHLGKLAATEVPDSEEFDPAAELTDCIVQLDISARRERITFLIEKQRLGSLTDSERNELKELTRGSGTAG
jgi:DNA primase